MSNATAAVDHADALFAGTRLGGEFELREVLGAGGFGIVYLAFDHQLQRDVAIKEYMPVTLALRGSDGTTVSVRSRAHAETFDAGRRSFVNEARLLARFDHRSLVKVHRFWEQHGTAYMAMPFYRGRTLKALVRDESYPRFDEARLRALVDPLLGALQMLHAGGVYHRDIAPDNIMVRDGDAPVLLDFGAARHVIGEATHALTAVLKPSFAPIEQYAEAGTALRQGPWTDIYAMAAVMRFALTGNAPLPATTRAVLDAMAPLQSIGVADASAPLLGAIDWALAVRPQDRPQSVAQWRDAARRPHRVAAGGRHDNRGGCRSLPRHRRHRDLGTNRAADAAGCGAAALAIAPPVAVAVRRRAGVRLRRHARDRHHAADQRRGERGNERGASERRPSRNCRRWSSGRRRARRHRMARCRHCRRPRRRPRCSVWRRVRARLAASACCSRWRVA